MGLFGDDVDRVSKSELTGRSDIFSSESGIYSKLRANGEGHFTDHQLHEFKTMISGYMDDDSHHGYSGMSKKEVDDLIKELKTQKTFTPHQIDRVEKHLHEAIKD
jgi:hypothetical protein